ncbi:trifolitoxin immunity protein [Devosia soli]|uniref:Trifolitoxin immunity protein n=1 Tax=Devosia soli TaxID=361041 RepID=A0A0F5L7B6_9HYPH|nr:aminoglycoside phosphotransferase family protein [Devosia soli]KKB78120.1 trifolitoxin immunity protein [Devosia soli]
MREEEPSEEISLVGGRSTVSTRGGVVYRNARPWSQTVIALLRHLEEQGYEHAPRAVGSGFDDQGREMLTFVEGESVHPYAWRDDAMPAIGAMLRKLHCATASFVPPPNEEWRPWFGRSIGTPSVIGHCDTGAWNIIAQNGLPIALIDWEEAGPVDPMVELAQACWLNALLFDDDLAETLSLGPVEQRAKQVRSLLGGYELPHAQRIGFVDRMIEFSILSAANEAIDAKVTPETTDPSSLWAITWRTRSAAWLVRHRAELNRIITAY